MLAQQNPAAAHFWSAQLRNSSFAALDAVPRYIPYTGAFRVVYVAGEQDNSVPPVLWRSYVEQPTAQFVFETLDADHVPMLSKPKEVVDLVLKYAA